MSEKTGSYVGVIVFAVVCGLLAYFFYWRMGNLVERILAVAAVVFCLGLLGKQKWALIGINLTLLIAIVVSFIQVWQQPIMTEDTSLILPYILKMLGGIILFIYIGRGQLEHGVFS
ncbi:MAG TPA: hypothetical protein VIH59_06510 [Candidatus Tectomicrobia bacterium]